MWEMGWRGVVTGADGRRRDGGAACYRGGLRMEIGLHGLGDVGLVEGGEDVDWRGEVMSREVIGMEVNE